jgi:hypothetical protein
MYDGGKVITGLVVFVLFITLPIWGGLMLGEAKGFPADLPKVDPAKGDHCVLETADMRHNHMNLLNTWRDGVVRAGDYRSASFVVSEAHQDIMYKGKDNKLFHASLTDGCLDCHGPSEKFCDKCHQYAGVDTYCWDCHITHKRGN